MAECVKITNGRFLNRRPHGPHVQGRCGEGCNDMKSLWKEHGKEVWSFYCPQCKIPRRVPYRSKPGLKHFSQIGLTAAVVTLATWPWFAWKGAVAFLPLWIVFEVLYRSRVRAALSCEQCGFDPILYLADVKSARREIEAHWKKKFEEKGIPYPDKNQMKEQVLQKSNEQKSSQNSVGENRLAKTRLDDPISER
jgi:hypothetical protein